MSPCKENATSHPILLQNLRLGLYDSFEQNLAEKRLTFGDYKFAIYVRHSGWNDISVFKFSGIQFSHDGIEPVTHRTVRRQRTFRTDGLAI
jgi:hypothetical protein